MPEDEDNPVQLVRDMVDYLMPELTPYETALYLLLFKAALLDSSALQTRIGKKRIAAQLGRSSRAGASISFYQITEVIKGLNAKGCIRVGDTTRDGTLYEVVLPRHVPLVQEKLATPEQSAGDYFTDEAKRKELFERDDWTCQYCGDSVTVQNATLDHYIPQCRGGGNGKENLRTCCLMCNAVKSGKSYEDAAPLILKSIQERRQRRNE